MERDSFVFYKSFYDAISESDADTQVKIFNAICKKAFYDEDIELNGVAKMLYTLIKPQLEASRKHYEDGKKGGRPKKEKGGFLENKNPGFEKTKTNYNVNENENVNVNVNDNYNNNASDSCIDGLQKSNDSCVDDWTKIIEFYNNNIGMITPYGTDLLHSFAEEMPADLIIYAMQISVEANKRTIQYVKAILNNWHKAGIKTLVEAKNESKKGKAKSTKKANFEQREYSNLDFLYKNAEA